MKQYTNCVVKNSQTVKLTLYTVSTNLDDTSYAK